MATPAPGRGALNPTQELERVWRERIQQAKEARRPYEKIWLSNLAFAAGQHWLVWDQRAGGQMRHIQEVDPTQRNRVLYTADRINEYLQAQYGELNSDDDRPEILTAQEGDTAEAVAKELNLASAHEWEHEAGAPDALMRARAFCLTMGVAAVRRRFDKNCGPVVDRHPVGADGQPITDPNELASLQTAGTMSDGSLPKFVPIHEGRSKLDVYTAFQILMPSGVPHEADAPWEVLVRPVHLDDLRDEYGQAAASLSEDTDIASAAGLSTGQNVNGSGGNATGARLRDHCWLYTCFRKPCRQYPDGQKVVLASNNYTLLEAVDELPYKSADGTPKSGIVYFHWWRLADRFWSRAFIEPLKDPQRLINETETVNREIFQRGLPKILMKEGNGPKPQGDPLEVLRLKDTQNDAPIVFPGISPSTAMYSELAHQADNLSHASTLSPLRLGENPPGIQTYGQLTLLNENEGRKRDPILTDHNRQKAKLVEYGIHDIRMWWPEEKLILVSGDEGEIERQTFQKSRIPDFFITKVPTGAALPRSQAAEVTKIDAIWNAAVASGVVTQDPDGWTRWYAASLSAGDALELPEPQKDSQAAFAAFENVRMREGEIIQPMEYDLAPVHVPVHREAQDQARAAEDMETFSRIQDHIDAHIQAATNSRKAWRIIDPADTQDVASDVALDEDQALKENEMMLQGVPLNPENLVKARQAVMSGLNPDTGKPLAPTDDVGALLMAASLKPTLVENLQVHLDRHGKVLKSDEFKSYPPDVRARFLSHYDQTRDLWLSLPMMPTEVVAPHVTLALRESVGPSTVAKVLQRAGVPDADPSVLASEEPMENMVTRDDTPAAPAAGPKPSQAG